MKLKIIFTFNIILLFFTIKAQDTWEYFKDWNQEFSSITCIDSCFESIISISMNIKLNESINEYNNECIIRLHDGNTGKVFREAEYNIDSLIISLDWIYPIKEDNRYVIVGGAYYKSDSIQRGYFLKTIWDSDLNLIEDTIYKLEHFEKGYRLWHHRGIITSDNELIHIGLCGPDLTFGETQIIKMNKKGEIISTQYLERTSSSYPLFATTIEETLTHDGFIAIGAGYWFLNNDLEPVDTIWANSNLLSGQPSYIKILDSDYYIISGKYTNGFDPGIFKVDSALNIVAEYNFGLPNIYEAGLIRRNIDWTDTSSIYIGAFVGFTSHYFILANFNSSLKPNWIKYYGQNDNYAYLPFSLLATNDGGCIIVGQKGEPTQNTFPVHGRSWAMKFDSDGNTVSTQEPSLFSWSITVYPNPSEGGFNIEIDGEVRDARLRLYDMQGREVSTFDNLNTGLNQLDMYNVPKGIYVWHLEKKGEVIGTGKWEKVR